MAIRYGAVREPVTMFNPKHYICQRADGKLVPDGRLDKPFWAKAPWTEEFNDIEGDIRPKPAKKTRAKMLWDDEYLYIGALLEEDRIFATVKQRDEVIFVDNDFEVFIDPDGDTHLYYEFEMNALGTVWDLLLAKPYRDGAPAINAFDISGLIKAVYIDGELNNPYADNKSWSVEIAMPWKILKECAREERAPSIGEYWRINFSRVEWRTEIKDGKIIRTINPETGRPYPEDNWVWSPMGIVDMHYPELWGFVVFADKDMDFTIPQDELIKWELRKLYYKQRAYFSQHGAFCSSIVDLAGDMGLTISPVIETTSGMFQITAPSADGLGEWVINHEGRVFLT